MVDLNKTCGEECKTQLDAEFGEGNCTFIQCDVSIGDALRGNTTSRTGTGEISNTNAFPITYCLLSEESEYFRDKFSSTHSVCDLLAVIQAVV